MAERTVEMWFKQRGLPWSTSVQTLLNEMGVEVIEHLKLIEKSKWSDLFKDQKYIVQQLALKTYEELHKEKVDVLKCATSLPICLSTDSHPTKKKKVQSDNVARPGSLPGVLSFAGFSRKVVKTADEIRAERIASTPLNLNPIMRSATSPDSVSHATSKDGFEICSDVDVGELSDRSCRSDSEAAPNRAFLALPAPPDWRTLRCDSASSLSDPASDNERHCWNKLLLSPSLRKEIRDDKPWSDMEDPMGYYEALDLNKTSSDDNLISSFQKVKATFHDVARTRHPDKSDDPSDHEKFNTAKEKYEKAKQAFEALGGDKGTFKERVQYDMLGERLRHAFKMSFDEKYNCSFDEHARQIFLQEKREQEFAKRKETCSDRQNESPLEKVVREWKVAGQQTNAVRLYVKQCLADGHAQADIARAIRRERYTGGWDGVARNDSHYAKIKSTLGRISASVKNGRLDHLGDQKGNVNRSALNSKSVVPGSRGKKVTDPERLVEKKLMVELRKIWDDGKRVTRSIIFRQVLKIDPTFRGGKNSRGHFNRLKAWFYHGLKRRERLSVRKICSVGQKLPRDWRKKHKNLIAGIVRDQTPTMLPDGSLKPGIKDEHYYNTDHVPFWTESVGSYTWGDRECHDRRNVKTGGKEKDRFTVQLGIRKKRGGPKNTAKLRPFIIFKGERHLCFATCFRLVFCQYGTVN